MASDALRNPSGRQSADIVECSAFAPPIASPGAKLFVQVYAHLTEDSATVRTLASEFDDRSHFDDPFMYFMNVQS